VFNEKILKHKGSQSITQRDTKEKASQSNPNKDIAHRKTIFDLPGKPCSSHKKLSGLIFTKREKTSSRPH
jgi:hypothetical protein